MSGMRPPYRRVETCSALAEAMRGAILELKALRLIDMSDDRSVLVEVRRMRDDCLAAN